MTARSLKTKYALTALGIGAVVALLLVGVLFWQYKFDATRLNGLAYDSVEQRLLNELDLRGKAMVDARVRELAPLMAQVDRWPDAHAVANEILDSRDVAAVELKDQGGTQLFTAHNRDTAHPAETIQRPIQIPPAQGAEGPAKSVGSLSVTLSRDSVDAALTQLQKDVDASQQRHLANLLKLLAIACTVLIGTGFVGAWFLARRIERPITALIKSADRIGQGDYTRPFSVARADEIGELQQALERMRVKLRQTTITKNYLNIVLNSMNDAVLVTSPDGTIKGANDAARKLLGYNEEDLIGKSIQFVIAEAERGTFALDQAAQAQDTRETVVLTRNGQTIPVSFSSSQITTEDPQFQGNIFVARNITERKRAERRIRYLARYDTLTKIPNRMQFQHLLQQALARAARAGTSVALLYLDMDHFKEVNDTFGHSAGDRTLEILTERLMRTLPKETMLGRLAGDEFAIFIENLPRDTDNRGPLSSQARIILDEISKAFYLQQQEVFLTASIGIAFCPEDAENVIDLIRNADAAMYYSKQNGGNSFAFYSREMNAAAVERLMLKSKLRRALEREELVILYQPKVDLRNGHIVGAEALLRWRLPGHGDIPPAQFIPLAEETNLILEIGEWVLNRVCADYQQWQKSVTDPGRVAMNLSLKQLRQASFLMRFKSVFKKHGVSPTFFELEITETTLMADAKRTVKLLDELYAMGLHLSIDDFGTGYSSLSALQQFPISTLKIDQSFVRDAATDADQATIVRTIIDMGRSLGMEVVAEGVESEDQLAFLRGRDCHFAQGRLFGDAVSSEEFLSLLVAQQAGSSNIVRLFA
ncbi:MAG TPA: EAL domain-containing protein [Steroidobacteraceae bacterium]|nr:EAL domain-containing protein [Steroidobacteraceae bacterium]